MYIWFNINLISSFIMASCRPSYLWRPVASIDLWQVVAFPFQWRLVAYGKLSLMASCRFTVEHRAGFLCSFALVVLFCFLLRINVDGNWCEVTNSCDEVISVSNYSQEKTFPEFLPSEFPFILMEFSNNSTLYHKLLFSVSEDSGWLEEFVLK